jgi:hypothetical protein
LSCSRSPLPTAPPAAQKSGTSPSADPWRGASARARFASPAPGTDAKSPLPLPFRASCLTRV